ncbi:MAG: metallophosphatase [Bacteroidales bacterium]|jgi:5'-nucleotidase|nr:metallophosphatase [Bacteroidales bacterium]MCI2145439.1 metallophosphatase [Bacteroidales bacterium]
MKRYFIRYAAVILLFCVFLFVPSVVSAQKLVILHTNDTHSQIEPFRVGEYKGMGGVERRLQFYDSQFEKYGRDRVLVLDAGDFSQGTPYFMVGHGDIEIKLLNILHTDVVTLGNHEFDNGVSEIARRIGMADFQVVCANWDFTGTSLEGLVKPYAIVERGGMKIGIIGATTTSLPSVCSPGDIVGLKLLPTVDTINSIAEKLKKREKCDLVILLSHLGFNGGNFKHPSDCIVAANSRDIDIIIGGHTHTFLKKEYPVKNLDGKDVMVTQTGCKGVYIGKLCIY